jgi:hypothetical protein
VLAIDPVSASQPHARYARSKDSFARRRDAFARSRDLFARSRDRPTFGIAQERNSEGHTRGKIVIRVGA